MLGGFRARLGPGRQVAYEPSRKRFVPDDGMAVGGQRSSGRSRWGRLGVASVCTTALCLATLPGAGAVDDDEDPIPSKERVRHAQERVATTADRVDAIEAALVAADRRLETVSIEAGKAVEAYNGARYKLHQART